MKKKLLIIIIILISTSFTTGKKENAINNKSLKDSLKGEEIRVCTGNWPPIQYEEKNEKVSGVAVSFLGKELSKLGVKIKFDILPWKRCLNYLKETDHKKMYHFSTYVTWNKKREKTYSFSNPFFLGQGFYVYTKKKYPKGLKIINKKIMNKDFSICGRAGFNYIQFGIKDNSKVSRTANSFPQLIKQLKNDRCDLFLERGVNLTGVPLIGYTDVFSDGNFSTGKVPEMPPEKSFLMLNRNYSKLNSLKNHLNQIIEKGWKKGVLRTQIKKLLGEKNKYIKRPDWTK